MVKALKVTGLTLAVFIFQYTAMSFASYFVRFFHFANIDKDGLFMSLSVHHIVQMVIGLMGIVAISSHFKAKEFMLKPKYNKKGVAYTLIFIVLLGAYYVIIYGIGYFTRTITVYDYELNTTNVLGTLGFQLFLSGPSEEILFRALPIAVYMHFLNKKSKADNWIAIILASLLFAIAHINFKEFTFSWFQLCYAFVLGIAYGFTLRKSKSVIYPMIMHSISNVLSVGGCYIYMMLIR